MATLHDFLSSFLSGLDDLCQQATDLHTVITDSAKNFYNTGEQLNGNIVGRGADAFFNVFALNNRRCELLIAKANDYYSAADSLRKGLKEVTSSYDSYSQYRVLPDFATATQDTNYYLTPMEIWERLRTAFATNANLDDVVNQSTAISAIAEPLNAERDQILREFDAIFQKSEGPMSKILKVDPVNFDVQQQLTDLQNQQSAIHDHVQLIVTNMQDRLQQWAFELDILLRTFINEVSAAANVDQITVSDLIYEANLPQNANADLIIEQLPNGGLLVIVKGGDARQIEIDIRNFISDYGYAGQDVPITIMGYDKGESVAQTIIKDVHDPANMLPFQITNAIMVGSNLPDPTGMPVNYASYQTKPVEPKQPWWKLTKEQYAIMGLTLLLAIPTEGASMALVGEEITGEAIVQAAGKLGMDKISEYAVALGYNSTHHDVQSEADFLAQKIKNYPNYLNDTALSDDGGKTVMSATEYRIKHNGFINYKDPNLQIYYRGVTILPEEIGLNTTTLKNDAFLGTQFIPDPMGVSRQHEGVSGPVKY